ncbi:phosphatase PAP2 family protein [Lentzea sp. BCCO 10_0798]|uniref:Phosphatase PAP2 family protein n=1 Tax=Lentzea kristufekii TaxID=3095430 RepID=A0ABU4TUV0_9PSEU|nr:phosphatase PAP2 family protein [Lentzea sp. BCCO 10_0798]MDX8052087.1 phosphatase PAP2 family protein [Lentzea sp. BCCO 10_0798]
MLTPWVWVVLLPFAVAASSEGVWKTLLWGLVVALTMCVIPVIALTGDMRDGTRFPLVKAGASLVAGTVIMVLGDAPRSMVALSGGMVAMQVASGLIILGMMRNISPHTAVAWAAVVTLAIVYGPWWLLLALPAAFVAWSRVELGDHTTAQVLAGSVMGVVVGGGSFWLLS